MNTEHFPSQLFEVDRQMSSILIQYQNVQDSTETGSMVKLLA